MQDQSKTKQELIEELSVLKEQIKKLEKSESERKEIEKALRESERRMKLALEGTDQGLWEWDVLSRKVVYDENWQRIMNLPLEGRYVDMDKWLASMDAEGRAAFETKMADYLADRARYYELEHRLQTENKDWKWIWTRGIATERDPSGIPLRMIGTYRDITKRKQQEEVLRESEEKYRGIFDESVAAVYIFDNDKNFINTNQAGIDLLGYSREELLHMRIPDVDADPVVVLPAHQKLLSGGRLINYEHKLRRKDGTIVAVLNNSIPLTDSQRNVTGMLSTLIDITDRKGMEEALSDSEERYRRIIEASTDAVILRSSDSIIYANPAALKLFRANYPEDLIGKRYLDLVHPDDLAISSERVKKTLDENWIAPPREHRLLALDGQVVHVESTGVPVKYRGETHIFGIFRDITWRKRVEEENRSLQERLQRSEKMEALGQLAGGVAHDLNNVLGILSGYAELLLLEIPEGVRSRGHAEKILQSTEKGAAIIQDLLTLARRGVMASDVVNLNGVVSDFLTSPVFEKLKDYHPRVTFRTEYDQNLLDIKGSPVHLEKTLMNLVSNAAESISGVGEVTIRTEGCYLDKAIRGYDEVNEGDYAVLIVSDTGMGIPAENREKIFEPFYTKKAMGRSGTGLGLAIVWGTVKDHNGYIDLRTDVGEGTTFTLYFPVTREERISPQQKESMERYMGHGESVLVVDDIAEQRDVASGLLTRLGYEVHSVSGGEEAVEYLKGNRADILVLDMIMTPGIDGLETYERILETNPKQKAILVSGFSETERVRKAQKLGAGAYVKKPFMMVRIGVAIRDELDRK